MNLARALLELFFDLITVPAENCVVAFSMLRNRVGRHISKWVFVWFIFTLLGVAFMKDLPTGISTLTLVVTLGVEYRFSSGTSYSSKKRIAIFLLGGFNVASIISLFVLYGQHAMIIFFIGYVVISYFVAKLRWKR